MKRLGLIMLALAMVLWVAGPATAEYINLPVKWSQTPWDPDGIAWPSDHTATRMADDFMCDSPDPIVAVRWWGSYIGEQNLREDGHTGPFDISFHFSVPGQPEPHPHSLPAQQIGLFTVNAQEVYEGQDTRGAFVYRYDAYLQEPFDQWLYSQDPDNGIIGELWIDISKPTGELWGWRGVMEPHPILDFAAMRYPAGGDWWSLPTDMAFELMTVPIPGAVWLLGSGLIGLVAVRRRFKKN